MKQLKHILFYGCILYCVSITIYWFVWVRTRREFNVGDDLQHALTVLCRVRLGESRCFIARKQFVPLKDLGPEGCGGLNGDLSMGMEDGFRVEVYATADGYSVKVHPINTTRLHSLYSDQTGAIRFGTRDRPATAGSPLLGSGRWAGPEHFGRCS